MPLYKINLKRNCTAVLYKCCKGRGNFQHKAKVNRFVDVCTPISQQFIIADYIETRFLDLNYSFTRIVTRFFAKTYYIQLSVIMMFLFV